MIFDNEDFGYTKITVERPLLDDAGKPVVKKARLRLIHFSETLRMSH